jgi:diaminohydroxyphosphoribosylaminopyrimidine deaminase/5-amino-6-(5-phosphoribosylamino)uracil reductase
LHGLLQRLAEDGINSVLVEGGAGIHGALMDAGLADELALYIAPLIIGGGRASPAWVGGEGVATLAEARGFRFLEPVRMLGSDMLVRARRR